MEITRLNIISDFVSPISRVPQVYASFWKWGALLLAIFATCTSLFARIRLYLVQLHSIKHSSSLSLHDHLPQHLNNESQSCDDDDDDDDDNKSLSATESESDDEEFNSRFACNYDDKDIDQTPHKADQDYRVAGLYSYRNHHGKDNDTKHQGSDIYNISELFTTGKNVVKQWDNLGLGFQDYFTSRLSIYDLCKDENVSTFFGAKGHISVMSNLSPEIIYSTEMSEISNGVNIGAYDRRIRAHNPVMYAEWGSSFAKLVGVSYGGVDKVYVKHGGACTIGDIRNFRNPLKVVNTALKN